MLRLALRPVFRVSSVRCLSSVNTGGFVVTPDTNVADLIGQFRVLEEKERQAKEAADAIANGKKPRDYTKHEYVDMEYPEDPNPRTTVWKVAGVSLVVGVVFAAWWKVRCVRRRAAVNEYYTELAATLKKDGYNL